MDHEEVGRLWNGNAQAWTDEAKAETFTSTALSLTALGALAPPPPLVIYAKTTAAIQYSTTVSGATGSPQYSLHIRVEAL